MSQKTKLTSNKLVLNTHHTGSISLVQPSPLRPECIEIDQRVLISGSQIPVILIELSVILQQPKLLDF
jgi:hypothetical protein